MCYSVYLSTDSTEDLTAYNSPLLRFERLSSADVPSYVSLLEFRNRWFVGSKSQCSCTFRHLHSVELGFGAPVDWAPEEDDQIAATYELDAVLRKLLSTHRLDLVDAWAEATASDIVTLDVDLAQIPAAAFRLFENHHFRFSAISRAKA